MLTFRHNNPFIHIAPGLILPGLRPQHLACTPCGHAPQGRGLRTSASQRRIPRENRHHRICKSITSVALRPGALFSLHTAHSTRKTFAGLPQTPKNFSRHLRASRKRQNFFRDTCGAPANAKKFFETLAGLPQTPKFFSWHLRASRKCQNFFRDTCGLPANAKIFFVALAGFPQTPIFFRDTCNIVANVFIPERQRNLRTSCSQ